MATVDGRFPEIYAKYQRLTSKYSQRDTDMAQLLLIREGRIQEVAPGAFPDSGPWQRSIVANMIDLAARDFAAGIAPLPTFNCIDSDMGTERKKKNATLRTQIANGYIVSSNLPVQMLSGADYYATHAFLPYKIEIDKSRSGPIIRVLNPVGCYPEIDKYGEVVSMYQRVVSDQDTLVALYPEVAQRLKIKGAGYGGNSHIEVIFYHDKDVDMAFVPSGQGGGFPLETEVNEAGECLIVIAARQGVTDNPRSQYSDVVPIQIAQNRMALYKMQAASDAVNAPIVVPPDVPEVPYGPGATIRTNSPEGVRRLSLEIPPSAFNEEASLARELQLGAAMPKSRTGSVDNSVVTGKGVQALEGAFNQQISTAQVIFSRAYQDLIAKCFRVDEKIWGGKTKNLQGASDGQPYEVEYDPATAIAGNYTVDVKYGMMAGMNPQTWTTFMLMILNQGLITKDFFMRQLPFDINIEQIKIGHMNEKLDEAMLQTVMGISQSIPALIAQGQDPSDLLQSMAKVQTAIAKGVPLMEAVTEAYKPKPEPAAPEADPMAGLGGGAPGGMPGQAPGLMPNGLMQGVAPGQQGMGAGGRPDLRTLMARLDGNGQSAMSAGYSSKVPV